MTIRIDDWEFVLDTNNRVISVLRFPIHAVYDAWEIAWDSHSLSFTEAMLEVAQRTFDDPPVPDSVRVRTWHGIGYEAW